MNKLLVLFMGVLIGGTAISGEDVQSIGSSWKGKQIKLSTSVSSLMILGDINLHIEKPIFNSLSLVGSGHIIPDSMPESNIPILRPTAAAYTGIRSYLQEDRKDLNAEINSRWGTYIELGVGFAKFPEGLDTNISFSGGLSHPVTSEIYYNANVGIIRFVGNKSEIKISPTASLSLGIAI